VTEGALLELARQGDNAAWEALVHQHQESVFRLAYLLLGDPDDAQDITQDAFIRAYNALGRFDAQRPLRPWLLRIASNLASNRRRSIGRYLAALARFSQENPDAYRTYDRPFPNEESAALWQALQRVKPGFREVIYLRYFLEMSEAEMAEVLGVAQGTVKSRLHRALKELRIVVEAEYAFLRE
jgi:RNA polymerase sigma factor (sigma-70 family)